jgi:hypothetical protein
LHLGKGANRDNFGRCGNPRCFGRFLPKLPTDKTNAYIILREPKNPDDIFGYQVSVNDAKPCLTVIALFIGH